MSSGINLVALTPSIDERIVVDRFAPGEAYDAVAAEAFAAGKAINAAAALATLVGEYGAATEVRVFGVVGAGDLPLFERFAVSPIVGRFVSDPAPTRQNFTLLDAAGTMICHVRRPTVPIAPRSFEAVLGMVEDAVQPGEVCLVAGRLPKGLSAADLDRLMAVLRRRACRIVVDLRPESLGALDLTGVLLAKPNLDELAGLFGVTLTTRDEIVHHARLLASRGPALVVVSLGEQGALMVRRDRGGYWRGEPLVAPAEVDPVGCGDSMVAGLAFALARGEPAEQALRLGMATGYANLFAPGPGRISAPHFNDAFANGQVTYVEW